MQLISYVHSLSDYELKGMYILTSLCHIYIYIFPQTPSEKILHTYRSVGTNFKQL